MDENYYVSRGGKVPVKWTAPEVRGKYQMNCGLHGKFYDNLMCFLNRPSTTRSIPLPVTCGALVVSCMRYGVLDINLSKAIQIQK